MKLSLTLIAFYCLYTPAFAQTDSLHQLFLRDKCIETHLVLSPDHTPSKDKLPTGFSNFEVVDFRPDTTRAGFWAMDKLRYEFVFRNGARQYIADFLNYYTQPGSDRSFLIIIKKLWLSNVEDAPAVAGKPADKGRIEFRGEAFLKTANGYLPFIYLDTLITSTSSVRDMARFRMTDLFYDFIKKIATADEALAQKRNAFTFNQLDSLNKQQFDFPMDTARVLRKGVYASVDEFRNNQPSIFNYEIQSDGKGAQQLYLKDESGKTYFSRKMWGYCDGQQCYAMMDGSLCPIFSVGHSFYVFGSKENQVRTKSSSLSTVIFNTYVLAPMEVPDKRSLNKMHFFTIDPYSGKIY